MFSSSQTAQASAAHWRCERCPVTLIYNRGNDCDLRLWRWTCCQCGFMENNITHDDACSCCGGLFQVDQCSPELFLCQKLNEIEPNHEEDSAENLGWSTVIFETVPVGDVAGMFVGNDMSSKVQENLKQMEWFLGDGQNDFDFEAEAEQTVEEMDKKYQETWECTDHASESYQHLIDTSALSNSSHPTQTESYTETDQSLATLTTTNARNNTTSLSCVSEILTSRDHDSGYGSISGDCRTLDISKTGPQISADETAMPNVHTSTPLINNTARKQLPPSDRSDSRLACPFYKHNRWRCKHSSCAKGAPNIHRLKEHLIRTHLYYQCPRCGVTFRGKKGAAELQHHLEPQQCPDLAQLPFVWGFTQIALEQLKCRKRISGKSEEQKWRDIHALVVPGAESLAHKPSSHLADKTTSLLTEDEQTVLSGSTETINQVIDTNGQHQIVENITREIIRLVPRRLNAEIQRCTRDEQVLRSWKQFTERRLQEILQEVLVDVVPLRGEVQAVVSAGSQDVLAETKDDEVPDASTEWESSSGMELFDFERLCS